MPIRIILKESRFLREEEALDLPEDPNSTAQAEKSSPIPDYTTKFVSELNKAEASKDNSGYFLKIPFLYSPQIRDAILNLSKQENIGKSITINFADYLNILYPEKYFPGGWKQQVKNAIAMKKNNELILMQHLLYQPSIKIENQAIKGFAYIGSYEPRTNSLIVDFTKIKKYIPQDFEYKILDVVVHELGHWINTGPDNYRVFTCGPASQITPKNYKLFSQNEEPTSRIGQILLQAINSGKNLDGSPLSKQYVKLRNIDPMLKGMEKYFTSESESQQRYYRPIKFWFAWIRNKYNVGGNLNTPQDYMNLLKYARKEDYAELENKLRVTTGEDLFAVLKDNLQYILRDPSIYTELVSTVKADVPQKSMTA